MPSHSHLVSGIWSLLNDFTQHKLLTPWLFKTTNYLCLAEIMKTGDYGFHIIPLIFHALDTTSTVEIQCLLNMFPGQTIPN
jgi:hypothetical protein